MPKERFPQLCLHITPTSYSDLIEITADLKNRSNRRWNNSAVVNLIICQSKSRYLNSSDLELDKLFEQYELMREGKL